MALQYLVEIFQQELLCFLIRVNSVNEPPHKMPHSHAPDLPPGSHLDVKDKRSTLVLKTILWPQGARAALVAPQGPPFGWT